jgi:hypothetical protein
MSYEVVTQDGSQGQFASNNGYHELIEACKSPALSKLFATGESEDVDAIRQELSELEHDVHESVRETAKTLLDLTAEATSILITDGLTGDEGVEKYSDDQPRDDHGRWADTDGGDTPDLVLDNGYTLGVVNKIGSKFPNAAAHESAVREGLARIPENMRLAGGSSDRVQFVAREKGTPARAEAEFRSGGISPGGYIKIYPTKENTPVQTAGNAIHEYGHAVDRWVGFQNGMNDNLSSHPGFRAAVAKDTKALSSRDQFLMYHVVSDPRETFAETYAHLAGAPGRLIDNDEHLQKFSHSADWIRRSLKL